MEIEYKKEFVFVDEDGEHDIAAGIYNELPCYSSVDLMEVLGYEDILAPVTDYVDEEDVVLTVRIGNRLDAFVTDYGAFDLIFHAENDERTKVFKSWFLHQCSQKMGDLAASLSVAKNKLGDLDYLVQTLEALRVTGNVNSELVRKLDESVEIVQDLVETTNMLKRKAICFDRMVAEKTMISMEEMAGILKVKPIDLISKLVHNHYLFCNDDGTLRIDPTTSVGLFEQDRESGKIMVTTKGKYELELMFDLLQDFRDTNVKTFEGIAEIVK